MAPDISWDMIVMTVRYKDPHKACPSHCDLNPCQNMRLASCMAQIDALWQPQISSDPLRTIG